MTITDLKKDALASLWLKPCSFEDLCKRFSISAEREFWSLVKGAIDSGDLREKNGIIYCKKSTARKLQKSGDYDLF